MEFELRSNGKVEIELKPQNDIEEAFVKAFLSAAEKGATVKIGPASEAMIVSIQK